MLPHETRDAVAYAALLCDSFLRLTGRALVPATDDAATALWHLPQPVVSHGTEADPVFRYGNAAALALWQMDWAAFTRLPSRLSAEAEPGIQSDRSALLSRALQTGVVPDYQGIRISAKGLRFRIEETVLWNVTDRAGQRQGQAALIGKVTMLT